MFRRNPRRGCILAHHEGALIDMRLLARAPAADKGACERRIEEIDRERVIDDAPRSGGAIAQPIRPQCSSSQVCI